MLVMYVLLFQLGAKCYMLPAGENGRSERREWIKPIMFSGGLGTIDAEHVKKHPPHTGTFIISIVLHFSICHCFRYDSLYL